MADKYLPLTQWLSRHQGGPVHVSFDELDALVGGLPPSALRHRAWWSNTPSHAQAVAWMNAGWQVDSVDLDARMVRFTRERQR